MMRGLFVWAIVIFSAAIAYVIAGILLFQPERPPPIQFEAVEDLIQRSQEMYQAQTPDAPHKVTLSEGDEKRKMQAAADIQRVLTTYENAAITMPPQAAPVMQLLTEYTRAGVLPPLYSDASGTPVPYTFSASPRVSLPEAGGIDLGCEGVGATSLSAVLMIGDDQDNRLSCTQAGKAAVPRILLGGPGNDTLRNLSGPSLFVPGTGNDTIESGDGAVMVLLEDAWGQDTLKIDCGTARAGPVNAAAGSESPWAFPFRHFVIFSPHIARTDIVWDETGTTLRNLQTGDTLKIGGKCVNLAFYDQVPVSAPTTASVAPPQPETPPAPVTPQTVSP
ncbi:MAG: hypothetical protein V4621_02300 [Pseudomonadota bacterium]